MEFYKCKLQTNRAIGNTYVFESFVVGKTRITIAEDNKLFLNINLPTDQLMCHLENYLIQEEALGYLKYDSSSVEILARFDSNYRRLKGTWVHGLHPSSENWMHVLAELLPSIYSAVCKEGLIDGLILDYDLPRSGKELVAKLFPNLKKVYISNRELIYVEKLVLGGNSLLNFCLFWPRSDQILNGVFQFDNNALVATKKAIDHIFPIHRKYSYPLSKQNNRIYIPRNSSFRTLSNATAVLSALESRGFSIFLPSPENLASQIEILRSAHLLVSQAGAALGGMMFMPPESKVIVLAAKSEFQNDDFFLSYGRIFGLDVSILHGQIEGRYFRGRTFVGSIQHEINAGFSINVSDLLKELDSFLT